MAEPDDASAMWDINAAPALDWTVLNDATQVASKEGHVVAIAYTVVASADDGREWLEFCWVPVDDPALVGLHFGVEAGTGTAWDTRWERARKCTEWEHARRPVPDAGD
jgi:hypothetical protein